MLLSLFLLATALPAVAENPAPPLDGDDLSLWSMSELINVDVTSVSRKNQKLAGSPAAAYVITAEDIRRSGATSIPELLRMVPGLEVARIDANKWAITSRGFNGRWANKLLVMMDGRTVYSPVFAGVYWDIQDTVLKDIDRIEIIRGPGAAIWGANAVNGVINIITKTAAETQGGLVAATAGSEDRGAMEVRYGGRLKSNAHYRAFAKYYDRRPLGERDAWKTARGGFRLDWEASPTDTVTVQGDLYSGREDKDILSVMPQPPFQTITRGTERPSGGNILARWRHFGPNGEESDVQFYVDRTARADGFAAETVNTCDFDFQHRLRRISRHRLQVGAEARLSGASLGMPGVATIRQDPFGDALLGVFVQDEMGFADERVSLVVGAKTERTGYAGLAFQPAVQLAWTPGANHSVWVSAAQAARTPALVDRAARLNLSAAPGPGGMTALVSILGNPALKSERVTAYETGYRIAATEWLSVDWTAFYNQYRDLRTAEAAAPFFEASPAPPHIVIPLRAENAMAATTYGMELATTWQPVSRWRLNTGYSWLRVHPQPALSSTDPEAELIEKGSPRHQAQFRSYLDLTRRISFDTLVYRVGALAPHLTGIARPGIPAYTRVDLHLDWRMTEAIDLSFGAQDLVEDKRLEYIDNWGRAGGPTETGRRAYAKITFHF